MKIEIVTRKNKLNDENSFVRVWDKNDNLLCKIYSENPLDHQSFVCEYAKNGFLLSKTYGNGCYYKSSMSDYICYSIIRFYKKLKRGI
jgi:hypothetical protein